MNRTQFYATSAQVIPTLLVVIALESEDRSGIKWRVTEAGRDALGAGPL